MSIVVNGVSKFFGKQKALNKVSFNINKGEIVGLLGPNGAGKTTLMRILTTYYHADAGTVTIQDNCVQKAPKAVQKIVGYLPENNPLYPNMYVKEYLHFIANIYKVPKVQLAQVIAQTGLTPEARKKISQLSKGYKQRVGLAAALLPNPQVLILDEPTTGLDPNQLVEIRKLIKTIGKDKTILLSTHIMKEVEAVCERVIILNKGNLVANNNLKELTNKEAQLVEVEFDYRVEEALLQQLPHVTRVKNTSGFTYEITFNTSVDMRPAVFDFAHDNQLKTLQLNRKSKNLERLFTEFTRENQ